MKNTTDGISHWSTRPYLSKELQEKVGTSNILVVPIEGFRGDERPVFANGTEEFFRYLCAKAPTNRVEIAIEEDEYSALALHSNMLVLAGIVVSGVSLRVVSSLIAEYLKQKLMSAENKTNVSMSITLDQSIGDESRSIRLEYEGPATDLSPSLSAVFEQLREKGFDPDPVQSPPLSAITKANHGN